MTLFKSKPTVVDAVQWTGHNRDEMRVFAGQKVVFTPSIFADDVEKPEWTGDGLELLAGKDGSQEWVPVPHGHWLVCQPGDKSDIWPVHPTYFEAKYEPAAGSHPAIPSDPYIVARYGSEWFVIHVATEHVTARCDDRIPAIGIATLGNDKGDHPGRRHVPSGGDPE